MSDSAIEKFILEKHMPLIILLSLLFVGVIHAADLSECLKLEKDDRRDRLAFQRKLSLAIHNEIFRAWNQNEINSEEHVKRYREWKTSDAKGRQEIESESEANMKKCRTSEGKNRCDGKFLSDNDNKILSELDAIQKSTQNGKSILKWAPVISVLTAGSSIESAIVTIQEVTDMASKSNAARNMEKLSACKSSQIIEIYLLDQASNETSHCSNIFFDSLKSYFDMNCLDQ